MAAAPSEAVAMMATAMPPDPPAAIAARISHAKHLTLLFPVLRCIERYIFERYNSRYIFEIYFM
jgi:hypothetical protein